MAAEQEVDNGDPSLCRSVHDRRAALLVLIPATPAPQTKRITRPQGEGVAEMEISDGTRPREREREREMCVCMRACVAGGKNLPQNKQQNKASSTLRSPLSPTNMFTPPHACRIPLFPGTWCTPRDNGLIPRSHSRLYSDRSVLRPPSLCRYSTPIHTPIPKETHLVVCVVVVVVVCVWGGVKV